MSQPQDLSLPPSGYQVDAENAAEMARLTRQAQMLSELFGLFPAAVDPSNLHTLLDIGCGPGEWAFSVAERFPGNRVMGIDISHLMVSYAQQIALLEGRPNVDFRVMDARRPLLFSNSSFDFIQARFISGFQSTATWPELIGQCFRLLRPGGLFCSIEFEDLGITSSAALTRYNSLLMQAARAKGQCFTPDGSNHYGITAMQTHLLRHAGFEQIERQAYSLDFSAGAPAHSRMYDNFQTFLKLLQPFLVRSGLISSAEVEALYTHIMLDMQDEQFFALVYFQQVWGKKPA